MLHPHLHHLDFNGGKICTVRGIDHYSCTRRLWYVVTTLQLRVISEVLIDSIYGGYVLCSCTTVSCFLRRNWVWGYTPSWKWKVFPRATGSSGRHSEDQGVFQCRYFGCTTLAIRTATEIRERPSWGDVACILPREEQFER